MSVLPSGAGNVCTVSVSLLDALINNIACLTVTGNLYSIPNGAYTNKYIIIGGVVCTMYSIGTPSGELAGPTKVYEDITAPNKTDYNNYIKE